MSLSPRIRKFALVAHLAFSVGWVGTVVAYLALAVAAASSTDDLTVRASWLAMELTGWYVIVPLSLASLLSGLVMALGSRWGLFRHYWVVISLMLTLVGVAVLLLHMPTVSAMADEARTANGARLDDLGTDLVHPGIGLVLLLVIQALNVYKPRGLTPYGQRRERRAAELTAGQPRRTAALS